VGVVRCGWAGLSRAPQGSALHGCHGDLGVPASDLDDSPVNGLVDEAARLLEGDSRWLSWLGPPLNSLVAADPRAACDRRPFAVRGECWR